MKVALSLFLLCFLHLSCKQSPTSDYQITVEFQEKLNQSFRDKDHSPLPKDALKKFTSLEYFDYAPQFVVQAKLERTPNEQAFAMPTTTDRKPLYKKYGILHFNLEGTTHQLSVFQSLEPGKDGKTSSDLFLPFTDLTSGAGSYGGGRYIDMPIPESDSVKLNFNLSYNPYCVYNHKYSCPLPPIENDLHLRIEAGVKDFQYK